VVQAMVAGDEMRRASADTTGIECGVGRRNQRRVGGKAEVIVAAERDDALAVDLDMHALRALEQAPLAFEMIGPERRQPGLQAGQRGKGHNGVSPSLLNSA